MGVESQGLSLTVDVDLFTVGAAVSDSVSPLGPGKDNPHSSPPFSITSLGSCELPGEDRCWDA